MANIKNHLNNIKNALFGQEVRGSIHDGIDAINKEVESTTGRQVDLEKTFDQLVINAGNSNAEIVDARVKSDGTSYSKLGDRLNEVDSQLEHNANNEYINLNDELNVINLKNIIINDTHKKVQGMCITNNKILCSVIKDDISATKLYIFDKSTYKHEEVKTISFSEAYIL